MRNSERFDRLTAMLKEVGLKQDIVLAEIRLTHEEVLKQNAALEQMHNSLKRSLSHMPSVSTELADLLEEFNRRFELLSAENREKSHINEYPRLTNKALTALLH